MTINLNEYIGTSVAIPLAKQGEYGKEVTFDFSAWVERFGSGSIGWSIQRPQDTAAYLLPSTEDGTVSTITLTETESQNSGYGLLEVFYVNTGETEKRISQTFSIRIDKSLQNVGEAPSPWQSYVDAVHADALAAEEAASSILDLTATATVDSSVGTPSVSVEVTTEDDHKNMAFAFSNIKGEQGETGNGISSVSVAKTATVGNVDTYTMTIAYTDGDSDTATYDVTNGEVMEEEFRKAFPTDTASGSIASYPDGADMPVKDLKVSVTPVQDLHGYANPWPSGGGANILDTSPTVNSTYSNSIPTILSNYKNDGVYATGYYSSSFNQNASYCTSFTPCEEGVTYQIKHFTDKFSKVVFLDNDGNIVTESSAWPTSYSHTATATEKYIMLGWKIADINAVMISKGNTAPSAWTPYSNICPITGWTGANVARCGKNLIDVSNTTHNAYNIGSIPNTLKPNTTYTFSINGSTNSTYRLYTASSNAPLTALTPLNAGYINKSHGAQVFTTPNSMDNMLCLAGSSNSAGSVSVSDILPQIELGSSATSYSPYVGNTYSIPFGQTVYGGTLDVTTGVLRIDGILEVFNRVINGAVASQINEFNKVGGSVGTVGDYTRISFAVSGGIDQSVYNRVSSSYSIKECNYLKHYFAYNDASAHWYRNTVLYAFFPTALVGSTAESVYNYLASIANTEPLSFWIPYVNPVEVQLSPVEVKSLLGQNNIYADCGDSEVEYLADVTLYIQKLTGSTEDDMVANQNIANNKYFLVGSRLFFSTSAIAQGASIVVGTNCTETNLADALNALNS